MINVKDKAEILIEALPYIQKYTDKVLVIKYGGNAMVNDDLKKAVMKDIVLLSCVGVKVVLVHGGGPEISETIERMGKETKFVDGLRYTDEETAEIVQMVLAGKVNKSLVGLIENVGGKAIGLCGIDGSMLISEKLDEKLGYVGKIKQVNTSVIKDSLEKGYIPVISTVGFDGEGKVYNINADTAAAKIAGALSAESLITLTDISGILMDKNDPDTLISHMTVAETKKLIEDGVISDGMIPKIECCVGAVLDGVKRVFIIDGRIPHSILIEILTDEGIGTMFERGAEDEYI